MHDLEYIRRRQKLLEKKRKRAAEVEAKKEAERVAKMKADAREQEKTAARKKLLKEQQENDRLHQRHVKRKQKQSQQKWDERLDILLAQIKDVDRKNDRLEEIRIIIQNREPSLQQLDWDSWISNPLNQKLADLDFEHALEMFKRDNLLAKRRKRGRGKPRKFNYAIAFTGDTGASAAEDYVTTNFNPDDYNLNLGFTVSYWVRPDEVGSTMFAFGRKHSNTQRFVFGISKANKIYIGVGRNKMENTWNAMGAVTLFPDLFNESNELKTGNWLHFVVTYADRTESGANAARKTYLNGELINEANIDWSNTGGGTGGMYFGGRNLANTGYNNGWACALNHVAIFDTAQSDAWVEDIYNAGQTGTDFTGQSGLVGYWKFNNGNGTTVTDHSGNGNHGTFAPISGDTTALPTWEKL